MKTIYEINGRTYVLEESDAQTLKRQHGQEMGDILEADWDARPLTSKQFVGIVSHLIEIARRSGIRPDYTNDLLIEAIQKSEGLAKPKLIL